MPLLTRQDGTQVQMGTRDAPTTPTILYIQHTFFYPRASNEFPQAAVRVSNSGRDGKQYQGYKQRHHNGPLNTQTAIMQVSSVLFVNA